MKDKDNRRKRKESLLSFVASFTVVMLIAITVVYGVIYMKPSGTTTSGIDEKVIVEEEKIESVEDDSIKVELDSKEVKVQPITETESYQYVPIATKEETKVIKKLEEKLRKTPNIASKEIMEDMSDTSSDDTILTNKNDKISDKKQNEKNKIQSNSGSAKPHDEMVRDNTPAYEAEKTPDVVVDMTTGNGNAGDKPAISETVSSGESTNGGYLN